MFCSAVTSDVQTRGLGRATTAGTIVASAAVRDHHRARADRLIKGAKMPDDGGVVQSSGGLCGQSHCKGGATGLDGLNVDVTAHRPDAVLDDR
jgi:hypothetical protein